MRALLIRRSACAIADGKFQMHSLISIKWSVCQAVPLNASEEQLAGLIPLQDAFCRLFFTG